jgi:hypothetical protein
MKHISLSIFCSSVVLLLAACQKTEHLEGKVTDIKTGKVISGVVLDLSYTYSQEGSFRIGNGTVTSDSNGEFTYSTDQGDYVEGNIGVSYARKNGYSSTVFKESIEETGKRCSNVQIGMLPLGGYLKLSIQNEAGIQDKIYVEVISPCEQQVDPSGGSYRLNIWPLVLPQGITKLTTMGMCTGDTSVVRWRFAPSGVWAHTDQVLIKSVDTTFFKIVY